ncbi:HutD family protein [Pseudomonas sp. NPDC007930]|uniref:HutD/Ves family protein n=1 Tax=Pseudomonas sp. NPDC007930 TaxID=3364417 RepID=UPI0036EEA356
MALVTTLRAQDYPSMPWKNGGGSTQEVARDGGDGLGGFGWRLSIASIGADGGFSAFDGYQRVITVLDGDGMVLNIDGSDSRPLLAFDPLAFPGASAVHCRLLGGAIRDFNLIYAPQRYQARLQWLAAEAPQRLFSSAATLVVFSAGQVQVSLGSAPPHALGPHDCLRVSNQGLAELSISGRACLIEFSPRG